MDIDPNRYRQMSKRGIIRDLLEHVVTSEEENKEKGHRSGSTTDLNLYLLDNRGYKIGHLDDYINNITINSNIRKYAKNYVSKHTFAEEVLGEDTALVSITTPEKSRTDDAVWIEQGDYVWVLTTERREWREKTIEKLIKYLPQVERLYLAADELDDLTVDDVIPDASISGFTAQYHSAEKEKRATLRFHGGRRNDLKKAERYFYAKPTRIEFDQKNSPEAAIQAASTNGGRLSIQSIIDGSQEKAVNTLLSVSEEYQERDRGSFEVDFLSKHDSFENGFSVDGFTAIELTSPNREVDTNQLLVKQLKESVVNGPQYKVGMRDDSTLRVYDTHHEEIFDLAVEAPNIIVYPRESATAMSLRSIVQKIFEYDSTYSPEKVENPVALP